MSRTKPRRFLVVRYDVTGWPECQVNALAGEAIVQGEDNREQDERWHPDAASTVAYVENAEGRKLRCLT